MNGKTGAEIPTPEEKAKQEYERLQRTHVKWSSRVEQLDRQLSSARETVSDLAKQMEDLKKTFPEVAK